MKTREPKFKILDRVYTFEDDNKENFLIGTITGVWLDQTRGEYLYVFVHSTGHKSGVKENLIYSDVYEMDHACEVNIEYKYKSNLKALSRNFSEICKRIKRIK